MNKKYEDRQLSNIASHGNYSKGRKYIKTVSFNLIGQNIKEIEIEFYIAMHLKD